MVGNVGLNDCLFVGFALLDISHRLLSSKRTALFDIRQLDCLFCIYCRRDDIRCRNLCKYWIGLLSNPLQWPWFHSCTCNRKYSHFWIWTGVSFCLATHPSSSYLRTSYSLCRNIFCPPSFSRKSFFAWIGLPPKTLMVKINEKLIGEMRRIVLHTRSRAHKQHWKKIPNAFLTFWQWAVNHGSYQNYQD